MPLSKPKIDKSRTKFLKKKIMKRKTNFILIAFCILTSNLLAQFDTIYSNTATIAVQIKEVLPDAVKYSYPNEEILYTVYKNTILKIKYKSGRVETFAEANLFKTVKGGYDWEQVSIAMVEGEIKGLFKIGEVSSKAKGVTVYSNMDKVKDRAYKKLKIEAAMLGANIVYLGNESVSGNRYGTDFQAGSTAETNLSGIAYSNVKPNYAEFKDIILQDNTFALVEKQYLGRNNTDIMIDVSTLPSRVVLSNVTEENGFIYVTSAIETENTNKFRISYFDESKIILAYRDNRRIYNLILKR